MFEILKADKVFKEANKYLEENNFNAALKIYSESIEDFKRVDEMKSVAKFLSCMGCIYYDQNKFDEALRYFNKAYVITRDIKDEFGMGYVLRHKSQVFFKIGDYGNNIKFLKKSLVSFKNVKNKSLSGFINGMLGRAYMQIGNFEECINCSKLGLSIVEQTNDKDNMPYALTGLGVAYFYKKEYQQAEIYLTKSLSKIKENDMFNIRNLLSNLIYLNLTFKKQSKKYDKKKVINIIKNNKISYPPYMRITYNLSLYKLLEKKSYLKDSYDSMQANLDFMKDDMKEKYKNYPIPKQIIKTYNKTFN